MSKRILLVGRIGIVLAADSAPGTDTTIRGTVHATHSLPLRVCRPGFGLRSPTFISNLQVDAAGARGW